MTQMKIYRHQQIYRSELVLLWVITCPRITSLLGGREGQFSFFPILIIILLISNSLFNTIYTFATHLFNKYTHPIKTSRSFVSSFIKCHGFFHRFQITNFINEFYLFIQASLIGYHVMPNCAKTTNPVWTSPWSAESLS